MKYTEEILDNVMNKNDNQDVISSKNDEATKFYEEYQVFIETSDLKDFNNPFELPKNERIRTIRLSNTTMPMACIK